jgi:hypothetical protein
VTAEFAELLRSAAAEEAAEIAEEELAPDLIPSPAFEEISLLGNIPTSNPSSNVSGEESSANPLPAITEEADTEEMTVV